MLAALPALTSLKMCGIGRYPSVCGFLDSLRRHCPHLCITLQKLRLEYCNQYAVEWDGDHLSLHAFIALTSLELSGDIHHYAEDLHDGQWMASNFAGMANLHSLELYKYLNNDWALALYAVAEKLSCLQSLSFEYVTIDKMWCCSTCSSVFAALDVADIAESERFGCAKRSSRCHLCIADGIAVFAVFGTG